jgi:hypothetical protein
MVIARERIFNWLRHQKYLISSSPFSLLRCWQGFSLLSLFSIGSLSSLLTSPCYQIFSPNGLNNNMVSFSTSLKNNKKLWINISVSSHRDSFETRVLVRKLWVGVKMIKQRS